MALQTTPHPRLLQAITADRWAIQEDALARIVLIAQGLNDSPESVAAQLGRPLDNTHGVIRRGSTAIVPVTGPIFRYANLLTEISGATSIQTLATDFRAAVDDPAIESIILEIDSPGGQVAGVSEFAAQVREATAIKPVIAYVSDLGASAAYWIASQASELIVTPSGLVGSIGVFSVHVDRSQADAADGVNWRLPIMASAVYAIRLVWLVGHGDGLLVDRDDFAVAVNAAIVCRGCRPRCFRGVLVCDQVINRRIVPVCVVVVLLRATAVATYYQRRILRH